MTAGNPPSEWERVRIKDCCFRPEYGYTASASQEPVGPKFLRITDIQDGRVEWSKVPYVGRPESGGRSYSLEAGDIVIARIGATTGKAFLIEECPEAVFASYLMRLRTKPGLLPKFLNYYFQTSEYWGHIDSQKGGRLKGGVNIPILESLEIPLPPPLEQQAIAWALDAVQKAKEARQHELALERERKAALMEYVFTHGTRGEPTKQSEIGEIPASWRVKPLCSIASIRYGLGQPPELDAQGVPMIRATDIKRGRVLSAGVLRVKREAIPEAKKPYLQKGDIIVVRSGAYTGDVAMYDGRWETAVAGYDLVVSFLSAEVKSDFLSQYLLSEGAQRYFKSQRDRAAQSHLNAQQLGEALIPLPLGEEQEEIARLLRIIDSKIDALEREGAALDELFRAMLEELMTGRLSAAPLIEEHQPQ